MKRHIIDDSILDESRKALKEFPLCDCCLGRLYVKRLRLSCTRLLGKKIKSCLDYTGNKKCFVCRDLCDHLDTYVEKLLLISKETHYADFLIGTVLKPSFLDRDDTLRSKLRARGIDSVKTEITRLVTQSFSRRSKKTLNHNDPDLTFLVNFRTGICEQRSKSMLVLGRYLKGARGMPQKQRPCQDCDGRGCIFCSNHGIDSFDSVEGVMAQFFYKKYGSEQAKFTWIGGEDKDSLVCGGGRPFFARIINPKKRNRRLPGRVNLGSISVLNVRKVRRIPVDPVRFESKISLQVKADSEIGALSKLRRLAGSMVTIHDGSKSTLRQIRAASYRKTSPDSFLLNLTAEGGISMKRLVDGNGIEPSVSGLLGVRCTCVRFDFEDIQINDNR